MGTVAFFCVLYFVCGSDRWLRLAALAAAVGLVLIGGIK